MIIAYLNQKGGVGKTTLAIHTAAAFALAGRDVVLVDADPQGSALDWLEARQRRLEGAAVPERPAGDAADPLFSVIGMPRPVIHKQVARIAAGCDLVVIDGPPSLADISRSAMFAADLVLIPVQPSPYDVWAAQDLLGLIDETRVYREDLEARFVVSRRIVGTAIGRDVTAALAEWSIPVLPAHVSQRVAFAESAATGSSVLETAKASPAAREIEALRDAIAAVFLGERRAA